MAETKINDQTFKTEPLLALKAIKLQIRLVKVLGAGIDRLPEIFKGMQPGVTQAEKEKANAAAIAAFTDIFIKGDTDEIVTLVKDIAECAQIKQNSGSYTTVDVDREFTDNLEGLMSLVVWVLREQFGSFFTGALGNGSLSKMLRG